VISPVLDSYPKKCALLRYSAGYFRVARHLPTIARATLSLDWKLGIRVEFSSRATDALKRNSLFPRRRHGASDVNHLKAVDFPFAVETDPYEEPPVRKIRAVVGELFVIALLEKGK